MISVFERQSNKSRLNDPSEHDSREEQPYEMVNNHRGRQAGLVERQER